jgi:hypothetical protein
MAIGGKITGGLRGRTCTGGLLHRLNTAISLYFAAMEIEGRTILRGHLTITVPALFITLAVFRFLRYAFGPILTPYFILTGLALSWQWYVIAMGWWRESLTKDGIQNDGIELLARNSGLQWPGASTVGAFALHTAASEICAVNLGPWLVYHWFGWILPIAKISTTTLRTDYYLQHLEVMSIVPAFVVGYIVARYRPGLAVTAWIVPTVILLYKLWSFDDPLASVLTSGSSARFAYYFDIVPVMPTFRSLGFSDPVRVLQQMLVVAPFYSGIAYSFGAFLSKRRVFDHFGGHSLADQMDSEEEGPSDQADTEAESSSHFGSVSQ